MDRAEGQGGAADVAPSVTGLRAGSIGLPGVVFQSIATMAPAAAVAFSMAPAVPHAGVALPLSVAVALVVCTMVAANVAVLARHLPSAGGFFTYVSRALGPRAGWLMGWTLSFVYVVSVPGTLLGFAMFADTTFRDLGWSLGPHGWVAYVLVFAAAAFALTFFGVKVSAIAGVVLGTIELAVFAALSIWLVVDAGDANTLAPFAASSGPRGWHGVLFGMLFVFNAFAGFEAAASFGEESRDPARVVPRALLLATVGIGVFFIGCAYAAVVGWGPAAIATYGDDFSPWLTMAHRVWGAAGALAAFAILTSSFGGGIAFVNAGARLLYAMGRIRVMPAALGRTSRFGTPSAIGFLVAFGVVMALVLGLAYGPMKAFALTASTVGMLLLVVYLAVSLAAPFFVWRERRADFRVLRHVVVPVVPAVVIAIVVYLQFDPLPASPMWLAGPINAAWLALGVVLVTVLGRRAPLALADATRLFTAPVAAADPPDR